MDEIRRRQFDAAIIFTSFTQSPHPPAYVCYLAGVPLRIAQSKEFGGGLLTQWVRPLPDDAHQVGSQSPSVARRRLRCGRNRILKSASRQRRRTAADRLLAEVGVETGRPFIALAPGASAASRRYDPGALRQRRRERSAASGTPRPGEPLTVVLLGSERESRTRRADRQTGEGRVVSLAGRTTRARTGRRHQPGHAGAGQQFRRRCTWPTRWAGPWSSCTREPSGRASGSRGRHRQRCCVKPTACSPCFAFQCPYNMECLDFEPAEVVDAALAMLAAQSRCPGGARSRNGSTDGQVRRLSCECVDVSSRSV